MTLPRGAGQFVVSIDVELAWGQVHHGTRPRPVSAFERERESVQALLDLMERHEVAATWAIVGHLFLEECSPVGDVAHPEVRRAPYPWFPGDWFATDPATSVREDPDFYAPDLVEAIKTCPVGQEIGSHSFSHQIIGDPACDADTFRSELTASRQAAASAGVRLRSFVYPRNSIAHQRILVEEGFTAYRGPSPTRFVGHSAPVRSLLSLADTVFPTGRTVVRPSVEGGLCNVPQTYLFDPVSRPARALGESLWARLIIRRLEQAARHGSLFHLWFHSHDIAKAPDRALGALGRVLAAAARERGSGRLVNLTMGQMAAAMSTSGAASQ